MAVLYNKSLALDIHVKKNQSRVITSVNQTLEKQRGSTQATQCQQCLAFVYSATHRNSGKDPRHQIPF